VIRRTASITASSCADRTSPPVASAAVNLCTLPLTRPSIDRACINSCNATAVGDPGAPVPRAAACAATAKYPASDNPARCAAADSKACSSSDKRTNVARVRFEPCCR